MKSQYNIEADEHMHIFFEEDLYLEERPQFHDSIELIFMTSGKAIAHIEEEKEEIVPGDIFFVDSYSTHFYEMIGKISAIVLVLSREHTERFYQLYSGLTFNPFLKNKEKNKEIISFVKEWMNKENKTTLYNYGCTDILFSKLVEAYPLIKKQDSKADTALKEFLMYIHLHYQEDISLNSMAHDLGYTVEYCSRVLKKAINVNFRTYINTLRLRKAKELEADNPQNLTQSEILYKCGFSSPATYFRVKKALLENKK